MLEHRISSMNALHEAKQLFLDGLDLIEKKKFEPAEHKLIQAHRLAPDRLSILLNLSAIQIKLEKFEDAKISTRLAISLDPTQADIWLNLGIAEKATGAPQDAILHLDRALELNPSLAAAWLHKGWCYVALNNPPQAKSCFDKAHQADPLLGEAWRSDACISLAALLYNQDQVEEAIEPYLEALASNHNVTQALQGLLIIYAELKRNDSLDALIQEHRQLIEHDALCNELLGFHYFNIDQLELAQHHFRQAALLSEHQPNINNPQEWPISEPRLRHDREQLCLLQARGLQTPSAKLALEAITRHQTANEAQDHVALSHAIGAYHYLPNTPFSGPALGENNFQEIEHNFAHNTTKLVVIDNFLSEQALLALRQFCEEATVWKRSYTNGYLGSFMASGFCSPVILEIARQLKLAMPNVIGTQDLRQAWGFKYDQRMTGINLHADFARVNINFWLTPDDACLDHSTGGIVVYDTPPPDDWSFEKANADSATIQQYLDERQAKMVRVPYKMNRCVLFDSTYFHATDEIHFKEGYENRRINCTLLFGKGL
ncbi:MAG: hypothetical protein RIQ36_929 [Pseudomonadota bacterium]|jgi:tetratricopeptide (TPR) repeat protein